MAKRETFFDGKPVMFIDDLTGAPVWASSLKELRQRVPGANKGFMYVDKPDGSTVRIGYVIGDRWLTAFKPIELSA